MQKVNIEVNYTPQKVKPERSSIPSVGERWSYRSARNRKKWYHKYTLQKRLIPYIKETNSFQSTTLYKHFLMNMPGKTHKSPQFVLFWKFYVFQRQRAYSPYPSHSNTMSTPFNGISWYSSPEIGDGELQATYLEKYV